MENGKDKVRGVCEKFTDRGGFEDVYETYDLDVLRYFYDGATELINELDIKGTESILDIGTGTGHTSTQIAKKFPGCKVLGIDVSEGMLSKAIEKKGNLDNLQFQKGDWENLQVIDGTFDMVVNSFGISFIKNFDKFVESVNSKLKEHSTFAYVNFVDGGFMPFSLRLYEDLLEMDIKIASNDMNLENQMLVKMMNEKGFETKKIVKKELCYKIRTPDDWWTIVSRTAFKETFFYNASVERIEEFKELHLKRVKEMIVAGNDELTVPVLIFILER